MLIRFTSASLLLQFRMSEIKTARPRIPSPLTAGISMVWYGLYYSKSKNVVFAVSLNIYLHESLNLNNFLKNNTNNYGCLQTRHFEATARANRFSLLQALELLTFCLAPLPFWFSTFSSFALNFTLRILMYNPLLYDFVETIHIHSVLQERKQIKHPMRP